MKTDTSRKKLLIISHDKIGPMMAGPGIRYHYMADYLSESLDTTIGFFDPTYLPEEGFKRNYKTLSIDAFSFEESFKDYDYILALWLSDSMMNYCNVNNIVVVFDIYAPVPVENLAVKLFSHNKITKDVDFDYRSSVVMYQKFMENGGGWMGFHFAAFGAGQITPSLYNKRPMYERFIEAPMGINSNQKLTKTRDVLRGVVGNINKNDLIVLWTGGIWDWFDAVSLVEAISLLKSRGRTGIKLVFLGTQHPNSSIPKMAEVSKARDKANELGLLDDSVYFLDGWVGYEDRINYLLEADIAVYSHKPSIETEFSHRTRVLDHFLASIPTVGTRGDYLGEIIETHELGVMAEPMNVESIANAIEDCGKRENLAKFKKNIDSYRKNLDWQQTLLPLKEYLVSDPVKIERLPSLSTPLSKMYVAKVKKSIPKPIKKILKKGINTLRMRS